MGAPSINIAFKEASVSMVTRGARGIMAMILKDSAEVKATIYSVTDIPGTLSAANQTQIKKALLGYQTAPKKIILYVMKTADVEADGYTDALDYLKTQKWNYLVAPTAETDGKGEDIASWIKTQRETNKLTYKAVLSNQASDTEGIVNVPNGYMDSEKTYMAEESCARAAGIICGTPLTMSATYAPVTDAVDCERMTKEELDAAVDAGKFVFFWDGEKVKTNRAVNSFVTTTGTKGDSFKKIHIVDVMDQIRDDITMTAQDNYIGKYANSYDNKCLLITAINGYFTGLVNDGVLESGSCELDLDAQRKYFADKGGTVIVNGVQKKLEDCTDDEIKKANTGSKVFLKATISILDAIEDIDLDIYIG